MPGIMVISEKNKLTVDLCNEITGRCAVYYTDNREQAVSGLLAERSPELVLVEFNGNPATHDLIKLIKRENSLPIIALLSREALSAIDDDLAVDDFLLIPYHPRELELRITRLLRRPGEREESRIIRSGELTIDQDKCEVTLSGEVIILTFKEYELLRFLAGNSGRVFSRETLLDKVWGYDYYGGNRTVDVHIRRLRSKTEDSNHTFIETVRNIGYRFK